MTTRRKTAANSRAAAARGKQAVRSATPAAARAQRSRGRSTIALKRVYDPVAENDGCRVLVDRLWPRGLSKANAQVECWWTEFAPTSALRKWLHADRSRFPEFVTRYRKALAAQHVAIGQAVADLRGRRLTLLTAVKDCEHSHAQVLCAFLHDLMR